MRELRLTAVSADGAHLILTDGDQQFALRADERLQAAIQGDRARLGQLEIQLENQLRPRDIQARVRAGESVESVAADATIPVEKIRRFAEPVLAERQHVADRAREATVRRLAGEGPVRTLETAAADYAVSIGVQPDTVAWDAWRADDGRWRVQCSWPSGHGAGTNDAAFSAVFTFDPSGRSATPVDPTARIVAGEPRSEVEPEPEPAPQEPEAGPARLSVVPPPEEPEPEAPAARDRHDTEQEPHAPVTALVPPEHPAQPADDDDAAQVEPMEPAARRSRRSNRYSRPERRRRDPELWSHEPAEQETTSSADESADDTATDRLRLSDIANHVETEDASEKSTKDDDLAPTAQDAPPASKPRSSRSRRPSVPSWDEIMFGRKRNE
ncbi:DUF3071 domain-containing protein [Actinobacteria bacterium YIM 96077]|uniref:DUF3071 domain-containing protein n=1 Tax=Phytoactinopolyspora halophila TaxID=1981511 RepID=A0A329QJA5_9ACTN|nr:septation protein SepH [Phytoactinopolyspora halophila]AYY13500.1 DUF3071 domain-containing protein [Actinobacteria bacterium YIM 96077]RAW12445.1 hypothetical protein DPM12_14880 [Phytoactinopolyspora halophila]